MNLKRLDIPRSTNKSERISHISQKWHEQNRVIGEISVVDSIKDEYFINLALGQSNFINGSIRETDNEITAAVIFLGVRSASMRRHGLGTRLMKAFVAQVVDLGAIELQSHCVSQEALHLRAKLFGTEVMKFYDDEMGILPIDFDQALSITEDIDARHFDIPGYGVYGDHLGVSVDLNQVDVTGWERPLISKSDLLITQPL